MKKFKIDKFIFAIITCVIIAYFFPAYGSSNSPIPLDTIGDIGISLIFFFYGLKLGPEKLKLGLMNWKLHVLIQASTFLLFPLIILAFKPFMQNESQNMIWTSFLFLAALPSTVSASVVMVSIAKGNVPAAIFNASISGLIGILITPLWMGLFTQNLVGDFNLSSIYLKLLIEILLPVALGLFLQRYFGSWANKNSEKLSFFDKSIILIIIYKSFAKSFESNVFTSVGLNTLLIIIALCIALFYTVYYLTAWLSKLLKLNKEDTITAQYCGTKKSLVHGTVFAQVLFPANFPLGMIFLPLMVFHAFQILIVSIYANKQANR